MRVRVGVGVRVLVGGEVGVSEGVAVRVGVVVALFFVAVAKVGSGTAVKGWVFFVWLGDNWPQDNRNKQFKMARKKVERKIRRGISLFYQ